MMPPTTRPFYPTAVRRHLTGGRVQGVDGSMWRYMSVPMAPIVDARSPESAVAAGESLEAAYQGLAALASKVGGRRRFARESYRDTHLLTVNVPHLFEPGRSDALGRYLRDGYPSVAVNRRVALLGVRLKPRPGGKGGLREGIDSVVETLLWGGVAIGDFDRDDEEVSQVLTRGGLSVPDTRDLLLADSWWTAGYAPWAPVLPHASHLHVFMSEHGVAMAKAAGAETCEGWTSAKVPDQHSITLASVQHLNLPFTSAGAGASRWIAALIHQGAAAVSVRARIEPGSLTRQMLRSQRTRYAADLRERQNQGRMDRGELDEMMHDLAAVERIYQNREGAPPPATLTETSVMVAFNGQVGDLHRHLPDGAVPQLASMDYTQLSALTEMMLCSPVRANPNSLELPVQSVAAAGAMSLSTVGDKTGVLLGFTETDRQPAYLDPAAASEESEAPMMLVPGQTGSGKTQVLLHVAKQFSLMGRPTVIFDPKPTSDFSDFVNSTPNGQVYSLDRLLESDGVFDPIWFSRNSEAAVELAVAMLLSINPWADQRAAMEVPLHRALTHGVAQGGRCIGEALALAKRDLDLPPGLVERVEELATSSPQTRAICGVNPTGTPLTAAEGITLIKVGDAHLELTAPGGVPETLQQRVAAALIRMIVFASANALAGRGGSLLFDEGWVVVQSGHAEVDRLGRLARSLGVFVAIFTQKTSDALNAGLAGYISRGLLLPMSDPGEAAAGLKMFGLEPTPERIERMVAKKTVGDGAGVQPNWASQRFLTDPDTGRLLRGTIGLYCDLNGRVVPVEIALPKGLLALTSTVPADIAVREARKRGAQQLASLPNDAANDLAAHPGPAFA